jgi:hypothetical protein
MEVIAAFSASLLENYRESLLATNYGIFNHIFRRPTVNISVDLTPRLSDGAHIYFPGSPQFNEATSWWSGYMKPAFRAVVQVATENDVSETVSF